jgi:ABC-type transport system involved in cytochrome c biogenesis permease component
MEPESMAMQGFFTCSSVLWFLIDLAIAGLALWRFRKTASGILLGLGHGGLSLKVLFLGLLIPFLMNRVGVDYSLHFAVNILSQLIRITLYIVVAAGIVMIPRSMARLAQK